MMAVLALLVHAALLAVAAPVLADFRARVAAGWRGEAPPPADQAWRDLVRLWRKPVVVPPGASFVFWGAPALALGSVMAAGLLVPSFASGMATAGAADAVVVVALLGLSQAAPRLAAHDAGSAWPVFAGNRAMAAWLPAGPVLMLAVLAGALLTGGTNLDVAVAAVRDGGPLVRLAGALAGLALLAVVAPGPAAGAGPYGGRPAALLLFAAQLRSVVVLSLVGAVGLPSGMAAAGSGPDLWAVGAAVWVVKLGVLGGVPGLVPAGPATAAAALLLLIAAVLLGVQGAA